MKYSELTEAKYDLKDIKIDEIGLQLAKLIKRDCKDFLIKAKGGIIYRGIHSESHNDKMYFKQAIRTNRRPRDTVPDLHNLLIVALKKAGLVANRNNSIFVQGRRKRSLRDEYGDIYVMFPIGSIDFTWSPKVIDITRKFDDDNKLFELLSSGYPKRVLGTEGNKTEWAVITHWARLEDKLIHKESLNRWIKDNYTDQDFGAAIKSGNEIMIAASSAYGIEESFFSKHVKKYMAPAKS